MSVASNVEYPIFDREVLDHHTMSDASLQNELFILFFDQMPVYLDQMEEAATSNDIESWRMAAHGIKGSSRALGFTRLGNLSRDCEASSPNKDRVQTLRIAIAETEQHVAMAKTG